MDENTTAVPSVDATAARTSSGGFLRLEGVLKVFPVSKSTWWAGVKSGRYPRPLKLSKRTSAWRESDIFALCESIATRQA